MASVQSVSAVLAVGAMALLTGCSSMEQKLSRGMSNVIEPIRMGELTRSTEQTYLADGPGAAQSYGIVHGVARTLQRTVVGAFEIVTFPIPTPTLIHPENPVYPDSHQQQMAGGLGVEGDQYIGFQDSAVLPFLPGADFSPLSE